MTKLSRRVVLGAGAGFLAGPAFAAGVQGQTPGICAGALLPLSGALSLVGDECLRGIALAVETVNAAGGIAGQQVTLATGDAYDQSQASAGMQSLITADHADVILGSGASALSYPGSAAAELAQMPYIELNAPADGITARGFRFLLRTCETTAMTASVATAALARHFAGKQVGLLFNTGATGGAIAAAALAAWAETKTPPLLVIGYPQDTADLHDPAGRLKRAGAEVILHAADPADVLVFFAALADLGWHPPVIGCGAGYGLRETAFALGAAFDGTITAGAPFYPPQAAYLADAYQARYAMPPRSAASLTAFIGAKLVFDTLNEIGGTPAKLLDALRKTDIPTGTLANGFGVSFDRTGQNTRSFATLQQWRGQALVPAV